MKKKILIAALVFLVVGGGVGYYFFNKKATKSVTAKADFELTSEALLNEYGTNEEASNKKYNGKILQLNGVIASFDTSKVEKDGKTEERISVILAGNDDGGATFLFEPEFAKDLAGLKEGDKATLKGICTGYLGDVELDKGSRVQ